MPCPHFKIQIISRGKGQSAVAAAAYQSGDRLFSKRDHRAKHYGSKEGIVYTEILLPPHAPPEYADRNVLWNAVERAEPNWNSQLARRIIISLPKELSMEENIRLIREYCAVEFASAGMIVDIGVHDPEPPGHNPHAHIMLTMRPLDECGRWSEKAHKEYVLDKEGNRIRDGNGKWKTRRVAATDWDQRGNAEAWRHGWELLQNRYLENAGRPERVSMKSFERQGIDRIPEVHMGPAASAMERKGFRTDIGNLNRDIRKTNQVIAAIRRKITQLTSWLSEIREAIAEIEMQPKEVFLVDLLIQKFDERKTERLMSWNNHAGSTKASLRDMQRFAEITSYMREKEILTVEALDDRMTEIRSTADPIRSRMKQIEKRIKQIETITRTADRY